MQLLGNEKLKPLSDFYKIPSSEFSKRGVLNPTINADTRVFIDPLLLKDSAEPEFSEGADSEFTSFFERLYDNVNLLLDEEIDVKAKEKIKRSLIETIRSKEKIGLCLGYSKSNNRGRGIGPEMAKNIVDNAIEVIKLGNANPSIFYSLFILEDGIGPDFISDFTARIIEKNLYDYTQRIAVELKMQTQKFRINGISYNLPKHPLEKSTPIILVPTDILSHIPAEVDFKEVMGGFVLMNENDTIRQSANRGIAEILSNLSVTKTSEKKEKIKEILKEYRLYEKLGQFIKNIQAKKYDYEYDPLGISIVSDFYKFLEEHDIDSEIEDKVDNL